MLYSKSTWWQCRKYEAEDRKSGQALSFFIFFSPVVIFLFVCFPEAYDPSLTIKADGCPHEEISAHLYLCIS